MKKKLYQLRSSVLTLANNLKKEGMSFGDAQRQAWKVIRCQQAMLGGEVFIRFCKEGDEIPQQRLAVAVTSSNYISKHTTRKRNPLQITYFEVNSGQVKSFNAARLYDFRAVAYVNLKESLQ